MFLINFLCIDLVKMSVQYRIYIVFHGLAEIELLPTNMIRDYAKLKTQ